MNLAQTDRRRVLLGYLASIGAAASYGAVAVIGRMVVRDIASPLVVTAFAMLFGTIIMGAIFYRQTARDVKVPKPGLAWLHVGLAGLSSAWGVSFFFLALSRAPVVLVAPLAGISPLVSIVLTFLFLRQVERVTWQTVAGAVFVVVGIALIAIGG